MKNILKSIGWVILNIAVQGVVMVGFTAFAAASGMTDAQAIAQWTMDRMLLTTIISNALFIAIALIINKIRHHNLKDEWKAGRVSIKSFIMPAVIAFLYSMFFNLITYNYDLGITELQHNSVRLYGAFGLPMMAVAILIFAPLAEEIMCRAIMMTTLKRSFSAPTAIVVSSLIFGLMHLPAGGVVLAVGATIMGLAFGLIYEKTGSLWVTVFAHSVANLPDFIFYRHLWMNGTVRLIAAACVLAAGILCVTFWNKSTKKENN